MFLDGTPGGSLEANTAGWKAIQVEVQPGGVEFALSGGGDHKVKQKYDNLQSMEKLKEKIA